MTTAYQELLDLYKDTVIAGSIRSVLYWDIETNKMPSMGLAHRSQQFAYLATKQEEIWRSDRVHQLLDTIKPKMNSLDDVERRNYEIIQRTRDVKVKIPKELISKLSGKSNTTNQVWKKAKHKQDFSIVQKDMEELFDLNRQHALKLAEIKGMDNPFDALIDERDEGLRSSIVDSYFGEARDFLVPFLKKNSDEITTTQQEIRELMMMPTINFKVAEKISDVFAYPYSGENARGSLDAVEHPLTISCGPDDIRVTIHHGKLLNLVNTACHELGHGLHGLYRNSNWRYQPINHTGSPTMGECMSRYTENKIGKTLAFHRYIHPFLQELVGGPLTVKTAEDLYQTNILVKPGEIRTSADEVSYGLHIIIRFELEQALFNDKLTIAELPVAWNQKYEEYLGVEVQNDSVGLMQDLHWFNTYWGYFHGYFMGDLIGTQFHSFMNQQISEESWHNSLENGDLAEVIHWHATNIYSMGLKFPPLDLLKHVTGQSLDVKYFKDYITKKYSK